MKTLRFVNLTTNAINLNDGRVIPSSGVARVALGHTEFDEEGICRLTFGEVTGLPDPAASTVYIVSGMLVSALPMRGDLVSPATSHPLAKRNEAGQIVSVPGFVRP